MPSESIPTAETLTTALKQEAVRLGFDLAGATPASPPPEVDRYQDWLAKGYAAGMGYLAEQADARANPQLVLEGVRSILMLGMNYRTVEPVAPAAGQGRVSRYAWGADYHDVIHERLKRLAKFHLELTPAARVRGVVDSAPLLERAFAAQAGLGWIGRNTLLIHPRLGSWVFLAAMLTTEELQYDVPMAEGKCGACRACLDACPTGALVGPYELDARRCISYLTIEHRGSLPEELGKQVGDRLFGCDACQEACPHNRQTPVSCEAAFQPRPGANPMELVPVLCLSETQWRERFRATPLWRARFEGMKRNAATVQANQDTSYRI